MRTMAMAAAALAAAMGLAGEATAQLVERSGAQRAWSVFESGSGRDRVCFIGSKPASSTARRDNRTVQVNRGDIWLMVAHRPGRGVKNEVSMLPGYDFRANSSVRVEVGRERFEMFTDGDKAWATDPAADDRLVAAFRRGAEARITGVSSRGTTTIDTFSLSGFTAALEDAQRLCR